MKQPDTVAVIIPTFNSADFIERAISSALQQRSVAEVIVIDDASTDGTCMAVTSLARKDSRVRLLKRSINGGPSAARNQGLNVAESEWIAFLDADDAYGPDRIDGLLQLARRHSSEMVADNLIYFDQEAQAVLGPAVHPHPRIQRITLDKLFLSTPDGGRDYVALIPLIRRSFLDDQGLRFDERIRNGEDFDFVARCIVAGANFIADLGQETYLYTSRQSGFSQTAIDDSAVVKQAQAWLSHPCFEGRPDRLKLVHGRIDILCRRGLDRRVSSPSRHNRLATLGLALRTRAGRRWLVVWLLGRVRRLQWSLPRVLRRLFL